MSLQDDNGIIQSLGEIALVCMNCDKELVVVAIIEDGGEESILRGFCTKCKCYSFKKVVLGKFRIRPATGMLFDDICTEDNITTIIVSQEKNK